LAPANNHITRCDWATGDPIMTDYHDQEWGVPLHDDRKLFENFVLDGFQAGLSWLTILKKREAFQTAFDHFEIQTVASYDEHKINQLLKNARIIRNRQKIVAAINNAQKVIRIQEEFGSFDNYIWSFVNGKQIRNSWQSMDQIPPTSSESDMMSKDMKKRGFSFAGSTICYAFMQAVGLVNDHIISCFCYRK
jgi:DNA-3-methyladenine glycosylase I